ncbi:MAG: hypothetical protein A2Y23_13625 [Clostridiales bacterium GWB2_37_7]|nr:MAG: hypothetical protein A2Y23_13625 [Clostridiales bacterium GWB2_37_7]
MRITAQQQLNIKPQLADFLSKLEVGDTIKGKLVELLGQSISIKTASGQVFTAALMQSVELKPGQVVELNINSITEQGIFAELKTENQKTILNEDAKLQQLLKQMDIKPEENNLQAAKLLLKFNMSVTKENITNLINTQKSMESLAKGDAPKAIALLQSELNINNTEVTKLVKIAAALEPQSKEILKALQMNKEMPVVEVKALQNEANDAEPKPQVLPKQAEVRRTMDNGPKAVLQQLAAEVTKQGIEQDIVSQEPRLEKLINTITKVFEAVSQAKPEQAAYMLSKELKITPAIVKAIVDNKNGENMLSKQLEGFEKLVEALERNQVDVKEMKQELKKLFIKPELLQDKEQVTKNFKDIVKLGTKLESLIREQGLENQLDTSVLQDAKNNMDFIKNINTNINYIQIPLDITDNKTTAEIYVFNDKKKSKAINPENATILIALDLNKLGHIESLISVVKKNVSITFKVEKEDFKKIINNTVEALKQALEARGYSLNPLKLIDIEEKFNLLELEELTNMDLGQRYLDIRV